MPAFEIDAEPGSYQINGASVNWAGSWPRKATLGKKVYYQEQDVYNRWEAVTPHDTNTIEPTRGVICLGAGDLTVEDEAGSLLTITVGASEVIKVTAVLVKAATTATSVYALY